MNPPDLRSRQGHRLIQIGVALFPFTSFDGFAVVPDRSTLSSICIGPQLAEWRNLPTTEMSLESSSSWD